nr:GntR family transcriptional regulator [Paenibacillus roseus]
MYLQVKKIVKDRILHGIYPLGTNIPPEPQLEKEFQVSKMTVRNAIRELSLEGYVEKKSGVGTIVLRNTSLSKLSKGKRFTELLVEEGHRLEKKLVSSAPVRLEEGSELRELFGAECYRIERLYVLNDQPYIHMVHLLSREANLGSESVVIESEVSDMQSLYELLEEKNMVLDHFRDGFLVDFATPETAKLLGLQPGAPVLKRIRYSYDAEGNLIEYSMGCYNTDLHHYVVNYDT